PSTLRRATDFVVGGRGNPCETWRRFRIRLLAPPMCAGSNHRHGSWRADFRFERGFSEAKASPFARLRAFSRLFWAPKVLRHALWLLRVSRGSSHSFTYA